MVAPSRQPNRRLSVRATVSRRPGLASARLSVSLRSGLRFGKVIEEPQMGLVERTNETRTPEEVNSGARKPYHKPALRQERVFESSALTCGKVQTTQSGCHQNRKTS